MDGQTGANHTDRQLTLPLPTVAHLVRSWRNHWAEVERISGDFPDDIRQVLALRPTDPQEALQQTVAQFSVLFHPEAAAAFVDQLDAVLRAVEAAIEQLGEGQDDG